MNRHQTRLSMVFALYQHLLLKKNLDDVFNDLDLNDDFIFNIKNDLSNNEEIYINEINNHLNKWTFDRLSYLDQAILLESFSEIKCNLNNKNIVIDEAIRIAKEYSDEESYKFINGVLDNL